MKRTLLAVFALALLAGVAILSQHVLWTDQLETKILPSVDVDLTIQGVTLNQSRKGKRLWHLEAKAAKYTEKNDQLTLTAPIITYFGEDQPSPVVVTAPNALIWQKEDRARMWENVTATQGERRMQALRLEYLGAKRSLLLTGDVHMRTATMQAQAKQLTYFLDSGDFLAEDSIHVILN